jgi:hypothetical protein
MQLPLQKIRAQILFRITAAKKKMLIPKQPDCKFEEMFTLNIELE